MNSRKLFLAAVLLSLAAGATAHARYYDPVLGRFISRDPIDNVEYRQISAPRAAPNTGDIIGRVEPRFVSRGAVNRYVYVESNPLSYLDPKGLDPLGSKKDCSRATIQKQLTISSNDSNDAGPTRIGGEGTLADAVSKINYGLGACGCIQRLVISAHADERGMFLRGAEPGNKPTWDNAIIIWGKGMDANVLTIENAATFASNICFCKPCEIFLLGCNVGLGSLPQTLANESQCTVYAPKGYCVPNLAKPPSSIVFSEGGPSDEFPEGLPAHIGASNEMGEFTPVTPAPSPSGPKPSGPKPPK